MDKAPVGKSAFSICGDFPSPSREGGRLENWRPRGRERAETRMCDRHFAGRTSAFPNYLPLLSPSAGREGGRGDEGGGEICARKTRMWRRIHPSERGQGDRHFPQNRNAPAE